MVITGKADEVVLWGVENSLYFGVSGEYMSLHILSKSLVVGALNCIYFIPLKKKKKEG